MFDSFSNVIFAVIALAIFIGRTIAQARKKNEPKPRIPVHFEDEDTGQSRRDDKEIQPYTYSRDIQEQLKNKAAGIQKKNPAVKRVFVSAGDPPSTAASSPQAFPVVIPVTGSVESRPLSPARQGAFNLNHLSPLKQAVVMAEILGPPKGLL